jgi:hypothetical protein
VAHAHAAKADRKYGELRTKFAQFHLRSPLRWKPSPRRSLGAQQRFAQPHNLATALFRQSLAPVEAPVAPDVAAAARIAFNGAMDHLRFSGLDFEKQRAILIDILKADILTRSALQRARDFDLADWMIVSGAIYNTVWNSLGSRPATVSRTSIYSISMLPTFPGRRRT